MINSKNTRMKYYKRKISFSAALIYNIEVNIDFSFNSNAMFSMKYLF